VYVNLFHVGSCGVLFLYNYIKVVVGIMQFVSFMATGNLNRSKYVQYFLVTASLTETDVNFNPFASICHEGRYSNILCNSPYLY
jgi:hypothetical protein